MGQRCLAGLGALLGATLGVSWVAAAQSPSSVAPPPSPPVTAAPTSPGAADPHHPRAVALTITPLYVAWEIFGSAHQEFPVVEFSAELRAHDKVGVALVVVGGTGSDTVNGYGTLETVAVEAGVEPRYYVIGDFERGVELGAELRYFRVLSVYTTPYDSTPAAVAGYLAGPFVGGKYTTDRGFTVEVKLGFVRVDRTVTNPDQNRSAYPITDLRLGWSF